MTTNVITALHLGNFKAFAATQCIPLRPLTLIYGPNSSGKSSIIHSLLLARHAIETGELDAYGTDIGGEAVDLGGFGQYVYKRDRSNRVEWAVDLDPQNLGGSLSELLKSVKSLTVSITVGWRDQQVRVESFAIEADRQEIIYMSIRRGKDLLRCDRLNCDHPVIQQILDAAIETQATAKKPKRRGKEATPKEDISKEAIIQAINELAPEITARITKWLPPGIELDPATQQAVNQKWQIPAGIIGAIGAIAGAATPTGNAGAITNLSVSALTAGVAWLSSISDNQQANLATISQFWLVSKLRDLILGLSNVIEQDIKRLRYLGPFRSYPPRHLASARQQDINWEAGGGAAWQTLLTNKTVREKVNYWLGNPDRMRTPYELVVRDLIPNSELAAELLPLINEGFQKLAVNLIARAASFGSDVQSEVERVMGDIEAFATPENPAHTLPEIEELVSILVDTEVVSEEWMQRLITTSSERSMDLVLVDQRSQTPVSHRDVGIGVSQVLPILVSCYALSETMVAIEQPELHLHPRLQAELADVFIESALGEQKNTFMLETHSEHLLLRIMRRMRETYNEELPEGVPPIHPEDVAVLYVDPDGPQSIVQEIPLNAMGELVKAWPGGFFEEGLEEVFA
jgi:hypothetical protein